MLFIIILGKDLQSEAGVSGIMGLHVIHVQGIR